MSSVLRSLASASSVAFACLVTLVGVVGSSVTAHDIVVEPLERPVLMIQPKAVCRTKANLCATCYVTRDGDYCYAYGGSHPDGFVFDACVASDGAGCTVLAYRKVSCGGKQVRRYKCGLVVDPSTNDPTCVGCFCEGTEFDVVQPAAAAVCIGGSTPY